MVAGDRFASGRAANLRILLPFRRGHVNERVEPRKLVQRGGWKPGQDALIFIRSDPPERPSD